MFPKYFHQTGTENDRMFIMHRIERFKDSDRENIVLEYERRYKKYGRVHVNAWLDELASRLGTPIPVNVLLIQQRLERLNEMSREKRSA
ncbi:TPA: hypothetical protein ACVU5P_004230 [Vibrio parahaemolyticus]